jgi:hypothetical protein
VGSRSSRRPTRPQHHQPTLCLKLAYRLRTARRRVFLNLSLFAAILYRLVKRAQIRPRITLGTAQRDQRRSQLAPQRFILSA